MPDWDGFSGGFVGVDIFFVISGYVIAGSLLTDLEGGNFSLWRFYEKRVRRIFPALILTCICAYVAGFILLIPDHFVNFSKSVFASATFVANFFFWKNEGYFDLSSHLRPLLHTWSLAIEEQFYLFAPLLMWLVYKKLDRRWLLDSCRCCSLLWPSVSMPPGWRAPRISFSFRPGLGNSRRSIIGAGAAAAPIEALGSRDHFPGGLAWPSHGRHNISVTKPRFQARTRSFRALARQPLSGPVRKGGIASYRVFCLGGQLFSLG